MNTDEAKALLSDRLARYRDLPETGRTDRVSRGRGGPCASGVIYQLEFQFFWDGKPAGDIRVAGAIDDGGIRALLPVCDAFIKSPDGAFVGE